MTKLVLSRRWLLAALLALGLTIPAAGWPGKGNGGGGGGGGEDPPPANDPGVRFTPMYFSIPGDGASDLIMDVNNSGQVVGYYGSSSSDSRAFVYDMLWETGQAVDLNDITIDIPTGHYIRKATGINEAGQISVYLDDATQEGLQLSAGMVDLNYEDTEGTVPKLYLVPDPDNRHLRATDINDQGDLVIQEQTTGATSPPATLIYNFGLTDPDLAMDEPLELLAETAGGAWPFINNRTQTNGPQIVGSTPSGDIYRLTVGGNYETFPRFYYDADGNLVRLGGSLSLNNLGEFCGAVQIDLAKKFKGASYAYTSYVQGETIEFVGSLSYEQEARSDYAIDTNDSSDVLMFRGIMHHGRAGEFQVSDWLNGSDAEIATFKETFRRYRTMSNRVVPGTDIPMVTVQAGGTEPSSGVILIPESTL